MHAPHWPTRRSAEYARPRQNDREPHVLRGLAKFVPDRLADAAKAVEAQIPLGDSAPSSYETLHSGGEPLVMPGRVYHDPIPPQVFDALSKPEQLVATAVYSRHHDGYVRECTVSQLVDVDPGWPSIYLLKALGDPVVETASPIADLATGGSRAGGLLIDSLAEAARENPRFFRTVRSQARSYWHAYYRREWPDATAYPGIAVCRLIRERLRPDEILDWR